MNVNSLVPTRFMLLIGHLVLTIVLFSSINENIISCLPAGSSDELETHKTPYTVGLSMTLALIGVELLGFISGITMFLSTQDMISIFAHFAATISLAFFIFESWPCTWFWWIFGFCSVLPAVTELLAILGFMLNWKIF